MIKTQSMSFAIVLLLASVAVADHYDVYLLAGQSNMDGRGRIDNLTQEQRQPIDEVIIYYRNVPFDSGGWQPLGPGFSIPPKHKTGVPSSTFGPELSFAYVMRQHDTDQKIAIIKGSKGGTSLRVDWDPGEAGTPETQGQRYRDFIETISMASNDLEARGDTYAIRGMLWHQGESDSRSSTETYQRRLNALISRIREDTGVEDLPIIVGEVFDNQKRDSVRKAIRAVGTSHPTLGFVTSEGTTTWDAGTHFDAASQWLMGQRYGEQMLRLQGKAVEAVSADLEN